LLGSDFATGLDRPIRVLHVTETTIAGVKRHVLDLLSGFASRPELGVRAEIACPAGRDEAYGDTSFLTDLRAIGLPVHLIPMRRAINPRSDVTAALQLGRLMRDGGYDAVHVHSSKAGALGRVAARFAFMDRRRRRPKLIYTPNGFAFLLPGSARRTGFYTTVERVLGRITDGLITVSTDERGAALARRLVPPGQVWVVPNAIDPGTLPAPDRCEAKRLEMGWGPRENSTIVVGAVGRLTAQKDPFTWLRAAAHVVALRPDLDLRFVWVSGGELEADVRALAHQLGLDQGGRVQFLGYRTDARELIGAFDIFTLASAFEGLPYVLLEALALGRPVVATPVGTSDVVRDNETGLSVPFGDPFALAKGIVCLADDASLSTRLGLAGTELVLRCYTTDRQVGETARVYREVLSQCSGV
jgi:glycosyltransferase involved in cell wall biosynthesis